MQNSGLKKIHEKAFIHLNVKNHLLPILKSFSETVTNSIGRKCARNSTGESFSAKCRFADDLSSKQQNSFARRWNFL